MALHPNLIIVEEIGNNGRICWQPMMSVELSSCSAVFTGEKDSYVTLH